MNYLSSDGTKAGLKLDDELREFKRSPTKVPPHRITCTVRPLDLPVKELSIALDKDPYEVEIILKSAMESTNPMLVTIFKDLIMTAKMVLNDDELPLSRVMAEVNAEREEQAEEERIHQREKAEANAYNRQREADIANKEAEIKQWWVECLTELQEDIKKRPQTKSKPPKVSVWGELLIRAMRNELGSVPKTIRNVLTPKYLDLTSVQIHAILMETRSLHRMWIQEKINNKIDWTHIDKVSYDDIRNQGAIWATPYYEEPYSTDPYSNDHFRHYRNYREYLVDMEQSKAVLWAAKQQVRRVDGFDEIYKAEFEKERAY